MRKILTLLCIAAAGVLNAAQLFYYSPADGKGGLRLATKEADGQWKEIGKNFNFVSSDFGAWGSGKKMFDPVLKKDGEGWKIIFHVNQSATVLGYAETPNFIAWKPQEYVKSDDREIFSQYNSAPEQVTVKVDKKKVKGRIIDVDESVISSLKKYVEEREKLGKLYSETTEGDSKRFHGLQPLKGTLKVTGESKDISPLLMGIFFEDINYAADGGLYAELIQNRDFEYKTGEAHNKKWGPTFGWEVHGKGLSLEVKDENPISKNNRHYAQLTVTPGNHLSEKSGGLYNEGYDGITLKKGETYDFNMKARSGKEMPLEIELVDSHNKVIARADLTVEGGQAWKDYGCRLTSDGDYSGAKLRILPVAAGTLDLDMVSLFPQNTFKGRKNGLRPDLAETLADLKPRFVRFPGGCVAHGNGIDNIYDWKGSIGALEERKPLSNLWGYHQTRGLGYYEYFQFCEDIGAEPLPVLAAGVPCQNSSWSSQYTTDDLTKNGQQCGIPMDSIAAYTQDILDLIEYANGPATSYWGSKRADAGHPEPFNLKYIGIGNEDMITEVFKERFSYIKNAVKEAYPEITVIGTTGPFYEGSDYEEGWNFARKENVDMVDEHYYVQPSWLIYNQNFYDDYDREGPKVYLGEWASHLPDRASNIETALTEAIYITGLERNGDVVLMSSYAPLLAKKHHTQWRPDLIYFDNDSVYPTTDYHVMRLAGENSGDKYLKNSLKVETDNEKVSARTAASVVKDSASGDIIIKLVNILPVESNIIIDLKELKQAGENIGNRMTVTEFKGNPDDDKAHIKEEERGLNGDQFEMNLAPYSFTVIRI